MTGTAGLPARPGTYVLVLWNCRRQDIAVGRLGTCSFPRGWYLYTGSAFGPGGLAARAGRHARPEKSCRWHIDYLTIHVPLRRVWLTTSPERMECQWANLLIRMGGTIPIPGFGASDCVCNSHLFYFPTPPAFRDFRVRAGQPVRSVKIL